MFSALGWEGRGFGGGWLSYLLATNPRDFLSVPVQTAQVSSPASTVAMHPNPMVLLLSGFNSHETIMSLVQGPAQSRCSVCQVPSVCLP